MTRGGPRLFIFDADGTLRWTRTPGGRYPLTAGDWALMPNVRERLSAVPWSADGPWLGVASNQEGVGLGELTRARARGLIVSALVLAVGRLPAGAAIELCTCPPGRPCRRRKPEPGLLLRLLSRFRVRPGEALFVGDLPIDQEAALRAGVPFRWAGDFFGWDAGVQAR